MCDECRSVCRPSCRAQRKAEIIIKKRKAETNRGDLNGLLGLDDWMDDVGMWLRGRVRKAEARGEEVSSGGACIRRTF